jgi:hypothetical protein
MPSSPSSQSTRHSPLHTPGILSSPEPTAIEEVASHLTTASFLLTLVTSYEDGMENEDAIPRLVDLKQDEYPPVSPGSAKTILTLDPLLTLNPAISATIRAMAFGLISTICQQMADLAQKLQEVEHKIVCLKAINQQRQADNRQLRAQLGLLTVPLGFECNQG